MGPITVRATGRREPDNAARPRKRCWPASAREAKLDITYGQRKSACIHHHSGRTRVQQCRPPFQRAACFVVPRLTSWSEFKIARRTPQVDWTTLTRRDRAAIFVPADVAPQETRDCLHEELAQALGPLNDLYRLPDSVFNDDNIHAVLTSFDMLILRAYYDQELRNGMSRGEAAARIPASSHGSIPAGERGAALR